MKLNPTKCVFGVQSRKLLGFIVSRRGKEANPDKINTILNMGPPNSQKVVQKLTGCMAALSRFLSRIGVRSSLFFRFLKKHDNFISSEQAQDVLDELKSPYTSTSRTRREIAVIHISRHTWLVWC